MPKHFGMPLLPKNAVSTCDVRNVTNKSYKSNKYGINLPELHKSVRMEGLTCKQRRVGESNGSAQPYNILIPSIEV